DHVDLAADDMLGAGGEVSDRDLVLDPVALPVHLVLVGPSEIQHRFAKGLRRDRAGVQADAADHVPALDYSGPPPELRRRGRRLLAAWARADHQEVEVIHIRSVSPRK